MWNTPSKEQLSIIPKLYETENTPAANKLIYLHFFLGGSDWYVAEYDDKKQVFWGFCILDRDIRNAEWGYFTFLELKLLNVYGGAVEVDCEKYWKIRPASEVEKISNAQRWNNTEEFSIRMEK